MVLGPGVIQWDYCGKGRGNKEFTGCFMIENSCLQGQIHGEHFVAWCIAILAPPGYDELDFFYFSKKKLIF
jgi:hypothetical protein